MVPTYPFLATDVSSVPRVEVCALGQEGRSLQPAQGGGLVTVGPELVVAASLRVLHVGLSGCCAVLVTAGTALSSLSSSALLAQQGLLTPLLEAEKCSVFIAVPVFVLCVLPLRCCRFSALEKEKNKHFSLSSALLSSCQAPEVLLGLSRGYTRCILGEVPRVSASVAGWGFLKGRVGSRAVEGRRMFTLVGMERSVKPVL